MAAESETGSESTTEEERQRVAAEVSELAGTVKRQLLILILAGFFLLLTLATPDVNLVRADAVIAWPLIQTDVQLSALLLYAPLALIALLIYLHVFYGRLLHLSRTGHVSPETYLFTMTSTQGRFLTDLLFYAFVPLILLYFSWRVAFREEAPRLLWITAATIFFSAVLYHVRARSGRSRVRRWIARVMLAGFTLVSVALAVEISRNNTDRIMRLREVDLRQANLSVSQGTPYVGLARLTLSHADMSYARLSGADLRNAILDHADLSYAIASRSGPAEEGLPLTDLTGASLQGATLERADLRHTAFDEASLSGAHMAQARLGETSLVGADLRGVDLVRATLEPGVSFAEAELDGARFSGAELQAVNFASASMAGAAFDGAIIRNVSFARAGMVGACFADASIQALGSDVGLGLVNFQNAVLVSANFEGARFSGRIGFIGANLTNASFRDSTLYRPEVGGPDDPLAGACLCDTVMPDGDIETEHCDGRGPEGETIPGCLLQVEIVPPRPLRDCSPG